MMQAEKAYADAQANLNAATLALSQPFSYMPQQTPSAANATAPAGMVHQTPVANATAPAAFVNQAPVVNATTPALVKQTPAANVTAPAFVNQTPPVNATAPALASVWGNI